MFSPCEFNLGGAFLIQQTTSNMQQRTNAFRYAIPSRYAEDRQHTLIKKPPHSKFLSSDYRTILPQYVVRKDLAAKNIEPRISNETPISFGFSLANRKVEIALKKHKTAAHRRAVAAEREQRAFEAQFTSADNENDNLNNSNNNNNNDNGGGRSASEKMRLKRAERGTAVAFHTVETPRERASRLENESREMAASHSTSRPLWNPSTQFLQSEVHGLSALLSMDVSPVAVPKADRRPSFYQPQRPASARGQQSNRPSSPFLRNGSSAADAFASSVSSSARRRPTSAMSAYRADGISKFIAAPESDMRSMLAGELNRAPPHHNNLCQQQQQQPGALVREAARRILLRVDCMGDRVSNRYRENIASNVARILPQSPRYLQEIAAQEMQREADLREHEDSSSQQQQQQQLHQLHVSCDDEQSAIGLNPLQEHQQLLDEREAIIRAAVQQQQQKNNMPRQQQHQHHDGFDPPHVDDEKADVVPIVKVEDPQSPHERGATVTPLRGGGGENNTTTVPYTRNPGGVAMEYPSEEEEEDNAERARIIGMVRAGSPAGGGSTTPSTSFIGMIPAPPRRPSKVQLTIPTSPEEPDF